VVENRGKLRVFKRLVPIDLKNELGRGIPKAEQTESARGKVEFWSFNRLMPTDRGEF
jgi:hypothetical protein